MQDSADARHDFLMLQQFASAGCGAAFLHCFGEPVAIFQHPADSFLHQLSGVLAGTAGEVTKLGFFVRGKMNFHKL